MPSMFSLAVLHGLGKPGLHVYGGTVPYRETRHRRARNKAARVARRASRR
jgi:hypothetical protein